MTVGMQASISVNYQFLKSGMFLTTNKKDKNKGKMFDYTIELFNDLKHHKLYTIKVSNY